MKYTPFIKLHTFSTYDYFLIRAFYQDVDITVIHQDGGSAKETTRQVHAHVSWWFQKLEDVFPLHKCSMTLAIETIIANLPVATIAARRKHTRNSSSGWSRSISHLRCPYSRDTAFFRTRLSVPSLLPKPVQAPLWYRLTKCPPLVRYARLTQWHTEAGTRKDATYLGLCRLRLIYRVCTPWCGSYR